mmetsp:Transcript_27806/g.77904  ORF Transcript_27806/g.77904 Transcript_27806/m.77904 type:complete len:96 (+) Transcript_27806:275-562(+)
MMVHVPSFSYTRNARNTVRTRNNVRHMEFNIRYHKTRIMRYDKFARSYETCERQKNCTSSVVVKYDQHHNDDHNNNATTCTWSITQTEDDNITDP